MGHIAQQKVACARGSIESNCVNFLGLSSCERQGASRRFGDGELEPLRYEPAASALRLTMSRQDIQNPAEGIVELIDTENWSRMQADTA